ncbi:MAG: hypothetical protein KF842_13165 [Caulobacter sp.]|nr:hypothetical protein [Caulobacter sp.]
MATDRLQERWRRQLVPLMVGALVFGALAFMVTSAIEYSILDKRLEARPAASKLVADLLQSPDTPLSATHRLAGGLETQAIQHRYELATGLLRGRLWTKMMGFSAGMVLALVGAAFVLGRLNEPENDLSAAGGGLSMAIKSSSPGLVMAAMGTALMITTTIVSPTVETVDGATYIGPTTARGGETEANGGETETKTSPRPPPEPLEKYKK